MPGPLDAIGCRGPAVELWGGAECTVNRVSDRFVDQTRLSGHHDRIDDLDLFADLGLDAIRYPLLWERIAPAHLDRCHWDWSDQRMARLRSLGIRPIAGLLHHGSGPAYTSLLDDEFAGKFGRYAAQVAERYPWITDWTPINEPLTTARFSALYGHWYPHARGEASFWRALLNQVDGIRAAIRAVRRVNAGARLIQTDDLGRTYATPPLVDQAAFDNLRRWASWDLLFGRVTPHHPLWDRLDRFGLGDRLRAIADDPCPPDIVGVNHYLTSDRFLDHRLQRYPAHTHGGNGETVYADVEAVRVVDPSPDGLEGALREAWQRYRRPVAVTEVHNGCTREEQLRWAAEAWDTAAALRRTGVDVRAVTAWSLLGSHGWNTLLTRSGTYEPGVFDVAGGTPRATALASLWQGLPRGAPRHPVTREPGWWRRPDRLIYPPVARTSRACGAADRPGARQLLICGAALPLAGLIGRLCTARGIRHQFVDPTTIRNRCGATLDRLRPWGIIDLAGVASLVPACAARGIAFLTLDGGRGHDDAAVGVALDALIDQDTFGPPDADEGLAASPASSMPRTQLQTVMA